MMTLSRKEYRITATMGINVSIANKAIVGIKYKYGVRVRWVLYEINCIIIFFLYKCAFYPK